MTKPKKEKPAGPDVGKIGKLLEVVREEHGKIGLLLAELEAELAGKPTIGMRMRQIREFYSELWSSRYRDGYAWSAKDMAALKRLVQQLEVEDLERRAVRYVKSADQFYAERRHDFALFGSTISQHVAPADLADDGFELGESAPADCRHVPICRSDREHTKRRAGEMRH